MRSIPYDPRKDVNGMPNVLTIVTMMKVAANSMPKLNIILLRMLEYLGECRDCEDGFLIIVRPHKSQIVDLVLCSVVNDLFYIFIGEHVSNFAPGVRTGHFVQ